MEKIRVIRDSVHGDIRFDDRFLRVVNTKEFQRLRRISQLAVSNMIFPSANHTRFSHSIGTYYLMGKIIEHLERESILEIDNKSKDLALLSALLHDIGHGPFSHAIENVLGGHHEVWTQKVILSEDTEVYKVLREEFKEIEPIEIANFIKGKVDKNNKLFWIIKLLISSQLDADRLDYLVRDSKNTGVYYGDLDLQRLISAIRVREKNGEIYICILEKNLMDVENYLYARYCMYESVYFHRTNCELEAIICLIFDRIRKIENKTDIPKQILKLIDKKISVEDYVSLDDFDIVAGFKVLLDCNDKILSLLCESVLYRERFQKIAILENKKEEIEKFEECLYKLIKKYNEDFDIENLKYIFISVSKENKMYKKNSNEEIFVLKENGKVESIERASKNINLKISRNLTFNFIGRNIALTFIKEKNEFLKELDNLIEKYK